MHRMWIELMEVYCMLDSHTNTCKHFITSLTWNCNCKKKVQCQFSSKCKRNMLWCIMSHLFEVLHPWLKPPYQRCNLSFRSSRDALSAFSKSKVKLTVIRSTHIYIYRFFPFRIPEGTGPQSSPPILAPIDPRMLNWAPIWPPKFAAQLSMRKYWRDHAKPVPRGFSPKCIFFSACAVNWRNKRKCGQTVRASGCYAGQLRFDFTISYTLFSF